MADPKVEVIKLSDVKLDPDNANLGTDLGREMLRSSLSRYGAGRSILLDKAGRTIAGNKTKETAEQLGIDEVVVVHTTGQQLVAVQRDDLDLDSPEARALAYADNRTSEVGLAWDLEQVQEDWDAGLIPAAIWTTHEMEVMLEQLKEDIDEFDDISPELPGAEAIKDVMLFESDEIYNIPALREDMLATLPQPIDVWCGPDAADEDWEGWWLYSYGTDSIRGLDTTRAVLAFYTDDYRFENWFLDPASYISRMRNAGITIAVAPNFSLWYGDPQAFHIFNIYRSRYVARFMQEAGIKVIPDVNWADEDSFGFCCAGIPVGAPCVSVQIQTVKDEAELARQRDGLFSALQILKPETLIVYGGGYDARRNVSRVLPESLEVVWIESRSSRRSRRVMRK